MLTFYISISFQDASKCRAYYFIRCIHFVLYQSSWRNWGRGNKFKKFFIVLYLITVPGGIHSSSDLAGKRNGRKQQGTEKQKEQRFSNHPAKMFHLCDNWSDLRWGCTFLPQVGMVNGYLKTPSWIGGSVIRKVFADPAHLPTSDIFNF